MRLALMPGRAILLSTKREQPVLVADLLVQRQRLKRPDRLCRASRLYARAGGGVKSRHLLRQGPGGHSSPVSAGWLRRPERSNKVENGVCASLLLCPTGPGGALHPGMPPAAGIQVRMVIWLLLYGQVHVWIVPQEQRASEIGDYRLARSMSRRPGGKPDLVTMCLPYRCQGLCRTAVVKPTMCRGGWIAISTPSSIVVRAGVVDRLRCGRLSLAVSPNVGCHDDDSFSHVSRPSSEPGLTEQASIFVRKRLG